MANEQISEITQVPSNATVIKIINALIKRYNSLGSIYTFKGSVQTYAELLAIENPNVGDVYNVVQEDEEHQIAAGSNFVWDGTVWDNLGGSLAGLVQSVNGINPDSLGNVLLPLIKGVSVFGGNIVFTKNDNTTQNVNNVKKLYISTLGENVDLNNIKESGIYICASNAYAANYENCPIQKAFLLEVQATASKNFVFQFLTQYNDGSTEAGNQYTRTCYNGNWSAWRMAGSGSNLTTYTSLEQIGITPGEETFAAIHNALPLNSELLYYVDSSQGFNMSIYPANYGYIKFTKQWNTLLKGEFIRYTVTNQESGIVDSGDNVAYLYAMMYSSYYSNRDVVWNKHYSVVDDGQLAKQSDLTNLSNTVVKSVNGIKPTNGNVDITGVPTGTILPFAGGTIPSGFLACNGAAVSRTTYAALFSAIGTTYGSGNGSTTFNLPAVEDNRFLEFSATRGSKRNAGLPNITGQTYSILTENPFSSGALTSGDVVPNNLGLAPDVNLANKLRYLLFNASNSNSTYGSSTTVQPKSLTVRAIIKY